MESQANEAKLLVAHWVLSRVFPTTNGAERRTGLCGQTLLALERLDYISAHTDSGIPSRLANIVELMLTRRTTVAAGMTVDESGARKNKRKLAAIAEEVKFQIREGAGPKKKKKKNRRPIGQQQ
jgi:hypothetical protein